MAHEETKEEDWDRTMNNREGKSKPQAWRRVESKKFSIEERQCGARACSRSGQAASTRGKDMSLKSKRQGKSRRIQALRALFSQGEQDYTPQKICKDRKIYAQSANNYLDKEAKAAIGGKEEEEKNTLVVVRFVALDYAGLFQKSKLAITSSPTSSSYA